MATRAEQPQSPWKRLGSESAGLRKKVLALSIRVREIATTADEHISGATLLERELTEWRQVSDQLKDALTALAPECRSAAERECDELDRRVRHELEAAGLAVVGDGQEWVVDRTVYLELNAGAGLFKINGRTLSSRAASGIAAEVAAECRSLRRNLTPPDRLARELLQAYRRQRAIEDKPPGSQLYLSAVFSQLVALRQPKRFVADPTADNFVSYPLAQFRADLVELMAGEPIVVEGQRFKHSSGWDTSGAIFMFVPSLGRCAHVSRIFFEVEQ